MPAEDLSQFSLAELFRMEAETQLSVLGDGVVRLETVPHREPILEELMRAAHSWKGAARVVGLEAGVQAAHALEDVFVRAKTEPGCIPAPAIDLMLRGVDLLRQLAESAAGEGRTVSPEAVQSFVTECGRCFQASNRTAPADAKPLPAEGNGQSAAPPVEAGAGSTVSGAPFLRVASATLEHLVGLAGESRILLRQLGLLAEEAGKLARAQRGAEKLLGRWLESSVLEPGRRQTALEIQSQWEALGDRALRHAASLQDYDRRAGLLADRLYTEALACRMRPFADCLPALRRLVRDTARALRKSARLVVTGESTQVDRETLGRLEAALIHLIRNALDHGVEPEEVRLAAGKPGEATIQLAVCHFGGRLIVRVEDDGLGIDLEQVRRKLADGQYVRPEAVGQLSHQELLDFLFLPGFSLRDDVTELSGRGVGLDAVQSIARRLRGTVRMTSVPGQGTGFEISVPISLSVMRCLLVEIAGEPWAIPLSRLAHLLRVPATAVESVEGRAYCRLGDRRIGLVQATQLLGLDAAPVRAEELSVAVFSEDERSYGLVVDRFLQQTELSIQEMPAELGKVKHFNAVSVLADGSPVLILDDEDLLFSTHELAAPDQLRPGPSAATAKPLKAKRILVVEDSLTVRELERKVLAKCGYDVETAVDGMDGWNKLRTGNFDLVLTDIDMPRMDGIELVRQIRAVPRFQDLAVMIVTYKDRPEDRSRGFEVGADHYLAKSSFHDDELTRAVAELIGDAAS